MKNIFRSHGMSKVKLPLLGNILLALMILILIALILASGTRVAIAQSGGTYDLTWNTFDGGGATFSTGGGYSLGGTIGQADARKGSPLVQRW